MARSSYVYVLKAVDKVNGQGNLIGAFTVKHEALSAIERGINTHEFHGVDLYLTRFPDGRIDWTEGVPVDWQAQVLF